MVLGNKGRLLVRWFLRITRLIVNASVAKRKSVIWYFVERLLRLHKRHSIKFLVLYLKTCQLCLMQAGAGQKLRDTAAVSGVRISRTRRGLPRIIPAVCRRKIRKGDLKEVRLWLTLFSFYRVLEFPGKLKMATITNLGIEIKNWDLINDFIGKWCTLLSYYHGPVRARDGLKPDFSKSSIGRYFRNDFSLDHMAEGVTPWGRTQLTAKPFVIKKAGPVGPGASTTPINILRSAWLWFRKDINAWLQLTHWFEMTGNKRLAMFMLLSNRTYSEFFKEELEGSLQRCYLGKLGTKDEPAGKIRVFAMVDCWTQWLLKPLHKALQELLRCIPQDGTFDQEQPVKNLIKRLGPDAPAWSYDLSAATDRLPVKLQVLILGPLLGPKLAKAWETILVGRDYKLPRFSNYRKVMFSGLKAYPVTIKSVRYAVGQPMGALSSWVMLALTHHFIVQYASWRRTGNLEWFSDYAVLGDDIVIADKDIADQYYSIMTSELGVEINKSKSLLAKRHLTMEFAKRYFLRGVDCSPLSFKELWESRLNWNILVERRRKSNLSLASILVAAGFAPKSLRALSRRLGDLSPSLRSRLMIANHPSISSIRWEDYLELGSDLQLYRAMAISESRRVLERISLMLERAKNLTELGKVLDVQKLSTDKTWHGLGWKTTIKQNNPILVAKAPKVMIDLLISALKVVTKAKAFGPSAQWPEFAASYLYAPTVSESEVKLTKLYRKVENLLGIAMQVDWDVRQQFHDFMVALNDLEDAMSAIQADFDVNRKEDDNPRPAYFKSVQRLYSKLKFREHWTHAKSYVWPLLPAPLKWWE